MSYDEPAPTREQLPVLPAPRAYVCPGEDHPIPRSIHLARLAAYFPMCRECEHRHDTGQLPRSTVGRLEQTAARVVRPSPFRAEGVRGEYLNHLTREVAGRVAAALADRLWEAQPLQGRMPATEEEPEESHDNSTQTGPVVVMGHDGRPSSPDLCVGVSTTLRRMGCNIIDVGRVTAPCHAFAVEHLQGDAGLFVTGSGNSPLWTGLDILGPRGLPWSLGEGTPVREDRSSVSPRNRDSQDNTLRDIERRFLAGVTRPTRRGGAQRYFDAAVPYRASLLKHYRDLRPQRVVCATDDPVLLETLSSIFDSLPCDLIPIADPVTAVDPHSPADRLTKQMRPVLRDADASCGVAIADDGRGLCLFDRRGRIVSAGAVISGLVNHLRGPRLSTIVVRGECGELDVPGGITIQPVPGSREAFVALLFDPEVGLGFECGGRFWVKDSVPACDAVLMIGLLLQALSSPSAAMKTLFCSA